MSDAFLPFDDADVIVGPLSITVRLCDKLEDEIFNLSEIDENENVHLPPMLEHRLKMTAIQSVADSGWEPKFAIIKGEYKLDFGGSFLSYREVRNLEETCINDQEDRSPFGIITNAVSCRVFEYARCCWPA